MIPFVHWDTVKTINGKKHYLAEITGNTGTHGIYLDKKKVDKGKIEIRNAERLK